VRGKLDSKPLKLKRRATEFHRQAKFFKLNVFVKKETFLWMVKPGRQTHPYRLSVCPVSDPLMKPQTFPDSFSEA